ncbi:HlyD family secretion protein [Pseudooceanicola algae]|uniref:Colistin resistance protein EmrA n=1 Tax=Pseudooceanicola algae TaxID=1537215 RepID=A0A418SH83_9RHOB|nr:HlyD family secretion protein [Pseudooceanicola algae]QPM90410.1 Colistin resistance protein EmrA [Pseudooceanicola algae]
MKPVHILPTAIATLIGVCGVLLMLFAWHLPPFSPAQPRTENAYVRGKVTVLAPQLSGKLSAVPVTDFQEVHEGELIAQIDDRIYRQQLAQAEADLASAEAALRVAEQNVKSSAATGRSAEASVRAAESAEETAAAEWKRIEALQDRGITSASTADQAELSWKQAVAAAEVARAQSEAQNEAIETARVSLASYRAAITKAEAALETARINLENTQILAPVDGRLGQVSARVGQYVSAGTSLVSIVGKDIWVIASFRETGMGGVQIGQPVQIAVDAMGGRVFSGQVESLSPATASEFSLLSSSNATGNFTKIAQRLPVRISINPGQEMAPVLTPGLSVEVQIETGAL